MSAYSTASRNCNLDWALGRIEEAESLLNRAVAEQRTARPLDYPRLQRALQAMQRLERMTADLKDMAKPSLRPVEREIAA